MDRNIQIDCIGDSLTSGIKPPSYPRILRDLFLQNEMENVFVNNKGKEGFTVGDYLAFQQSEPNKSLLERRVIDIFLILLGSNDTRDSKNTSIEEYEKSYRRLLNIYRQKTDHIFILNIPLYDAPVRIFWQSEYHTFDAVNRIENEFNPMLKSVSNESGFPIIDINRPLKIAGMDIFLDGIHPNPDGNKIIAETCYQALQSIVKKLLK